MGNALLLDTHIALWLDSGEEQIRPATRDLVDGCWRSGGTIYLSAVTAWEIGLLVDRGRLEIDLPPPAWIERYLDRPGIAAVPLSLAAAARSYALPGLEARDPADRLLVATAIELGCPLVTYDTSLQRFARRHGARHRFAVLDSA